MKMVATAIETCWWKKVRDKNTLYTYTRAFVCHIV